MALLAWYGFVSSGSLIGMAEVLWIVVILSILEISLSFDNAVVNASVLKEMDEVWQKRFLTWGIAFAVFGMRIVFPLAIVAIAASIGPMEALNLSLNDPAKYEALVSSAHIGIAGFGGAFLAMVGMKFFFDADKEVHWIGAIERSLSKVSALPAVEIAILLLTMWGISTFLLGRRSAHLPRRRDARPGHLHRGRSGEPLARNARRSSAAFRRGGPQRAWADFSTSTSSTRASALMG